MAHPPLQGLHAAHEGARQCDEVVDAKMLEEAVSALHHVADRKVREVRAVLRRVGARRRREAVADRIRLDDEQLVDVEPLAGADQDEAMR